VHGSQLSAAISISPCNRIQIMNILDWEQTSETTLTSRKEDWFRADATHYFILMLQVRCNSK